MNKKNLTILAILAVVLLAVVVSWKLAKKANPTQDLVPNNQSASQEQQKSSQPTENIQTLQGVLSEADFSFVKITQNDGSEKTLNIKEEAQPIFLGIDQEFGQKVGQENETLYKEIGLFDIPLGSRVLVEYDSNTDNLKKIVVQEEAQPADQAEE